MYVFIYLFFIAFIETPTHRTPHKTQPGVLDDPTGAGPA
jgi:hypothetical protein